MNNKKIIVFIGGMITPVICAVIVMLTMGYGKPPDPQMVAKIQLKHIAAMNSELEKLSKNDVMLDFIQRHVVITTYINDELSNRPNGQAISSLKHFVTQSLLSEIISMDEMSRCFAKDEEAWALKYRDYIINSLASSNNSRHEIETLQNTAKNTITTLGNKQKDPRDRSIKNANDIILACDLVLKAMSKQ